MKIKLPIYTKPSGNLIPVIMLSVSLTGFLLFYFFPFLYSFYFSMLDNPITRNFAGAQNFLALAKNEFFLRGLKNTSLFILIVLPLNIIISLILALAVNKTRIFMGLFGLVFLIPLVIPSATMAFFWKNIFGINGALNYVLLRFGFTSKDWLNSDYALFVIVLIFLWKNAGFNMVLFMAGLNNIPDEYYEFSEISGANAFQRFCGITLVYLIPTFFITLIMTFVNSFKVFKEVYLITGDFPHEKLYMLQHFMNNMFLSLNFQKLSSVIYILTVSVVAIVVTLFKIEKRVSADLQG